MAHCFRKNDFFKALLLSKIETSSKFEKEDVMKGVDAITGLSC